MFSWRKLKWVMVALFALAAILILCANLWVVISTEDKVFTNINSLDGHKVALVLGTSKKLTSGASNPFFENRIKAAAELYRDGKISHFIVSGDNRTLYYNEPMEMKKALIQLGVPETVITLDYAGLRTLDSIVRSKEIFGQEKITIITQSFHCYRALFISNFYDIDAVALVTQDSTAETPIRVYIRECFARTKAVLDLYVLNTAPRHLGEKEPLDI
ncbi:MAG: YdcF family protein [Bacteroidetes bacterium]|nr:YdcF family protein [Bacteroidota bacterium]MBI3482355.1 YdcF family protein [Bacteroidota bacterium]